MVPLLEALLSMFPFVVLGFHADNGSEYVNRRVAALLNKLHVGEFTKSRPRRSNDNALVEGKNAHVVRRRLGHEHIPVRFAGDVGRFAREHPSPFLNFHRPCLFATERVDAKGKANLPPGGRGHAAGDNLRSASSFRGCATFGAIPRRGVRHSPAASLGSSMPSAVGIRADRDGRAAGMARPPSRHSDLAQGAW